MNLTAQVNTTTVTLRVNGANEFADTIKARVEGLTKKAYSWSKYGGSNLGLVQENKTPEWKCQTCGDTQTNQMPSYMFEFEPKEFIRICTMCQHIKLQTKVSSLTSLLDIVRLQHEIY